VKQLDNTTFLLCDGSIINFMNDGAVELFGDKEWKKPYKDIQLSKRHGHHVCKSCHEFKYNSKKEAIEIWTLVDKMLKSQSSKVCKN